jgi:hypothetical protein
MNALIYPAAGFSLSVEAELQLGAYHFSPELGQLALGPQLRLIRFVGLIGKRIDCAGNNALFQGPT